MTLAQLKSKLEKTTEHLQKELNQIRTGRASPTVLEDITVDAYGSKMRLVELGSIVVQDSQNLIVTPWDKGLLGVIARSIRESDLHLNPVEESDKLRVPIPPLTEERRREFTRVVASKVEDAKNAMRNIRQEAMKDIDKDFAAKLIGEDEKFRLREEVEKVVKEYVKNAQDMGDCKKDDIMTI